MWMKATVAHAAAMSRSQAGRAAAERPSASSTVNGGPSMMHQRYDRSAALPSGHRRVELHIPCSDVVAHRQGVDVDASGFGA